MMTANGNGARPVVAGLELGKAQPPANSVLSLCDAAAELARKLGGVQRLSLRAGDCAVDVEFSPPAGPFGASTAPVATVADSASGDGAHSIDGSDSSDGSDCAVVRAPLVGTFYAAPSPGDDPFVQVGDEIEVGQSIGIVEAMKLMNRVTSEVAGIVAEVLVPDAGAVEYDQPLVRVEVGAGPAARSADVGQG